MCRNDHLQEYAVLKYLSSFLDPPTDLESELSRLRVWLTTRLLKHSTCIRLFDPCQRRLH